MIKTLPALLGSASRVALRTGLALALLVPVTAVPVLYPLEAAAQNPRDANGPRSFSDLIEQVMPAVVNISAVTTTENAGRTLPQLPQLGPETPFGDLFEEFFKRQMRQASRAKHRKRAPTRMVAQARVKTRASAARSQPVPAS
jgi:serine protease Do